MRTSSGKKLTAMPRSPQVVKALGDVAFWQAWLGLADWTIDVRVLSIAHASYLSSPANVRWVAASRRATVRVVHPGHDIVDGLNDVIPFEYMLVHELMHIVLAPLDDAMRKERSDDYGRLLEVAIEQPVDRLARTLVMLRRGEALDAAGANATLIGVREQVTP